MNTDLEMKITAIPANPMFAFDSNNCAIKKRRVAAYARVSTDMEEQENSFNKQVNYYTDYIKSNLNWHFIRVYTDDGISGTSMKRRDGFNQMIQDAIDGKIDYIITKSISRFARNTVDTLTTIRKLKELNIDVYFEKENITILDGKGELIITIMSSLAQEESRSISENVTWGKRKQFADGKVTMAYKHFLGYEKSEDGKPQIVESEAETVRLIYRLGLEGTTDNKIAQHLMGLGIPSPTGKPKWYASTVHSILTNERYCGNALLQKTFCSDFLTKKIKVNRGEVQQYYVTNSHPAIISPEVFELVQAEMQKRKNDGVRQGSNSCFSSKIFCGECGEMYGSKVWHSTSKYRKTIWRCNARYSDTKCTTPMLNESDIEKVFIMAFNRLIADKDKLFDEYIGLIDELLDVSDLDVKIEKIKEGAEIINEQIRKSNIENATKAQDQVEFNTRKNELIYQYDKLVKKLNGINNEKQSRSMRRLSIIQTIEELKQHDVLLESFDEDLWYATVDRVTVHSKSNVVVIFKSGSTVSVSI